MKKFCHKAYHFGINVIWIIGLVALSAAAGHYMTAGNPNTAMAQDTVLVAK